MKKIIRKIVIIGPESTGKSTISEALATYFKTGFVPEYARAYLDELKRPYEYDDLWKIANGQLAAEDSVCQTMQGEFLFCDTDLYVLKVWSENSYGHCDERILRTIAQREYDFYFLTDIDLPWEPDPQREHPEPRMRQYFFRIYKDIVIHSGLPWALLRGNEAQRLESAVKMMRQHFG